MRDGHFGVPHSPAAVVIGEVEILLHAALFIEARAAIPPSVPRTASTLAHPCRAMPSTRTSRTCAGGPCGRSAVQAGPPWRWNRRSPAAPCAFTACMTAGTSICRTQRRCWARTAGFGKRPGYARPGRRAAGLPAPRRLGGAARRLKPPWQNCHGGGPAASDGHKPGPMPVRLRPLGPWPDARRA